VKEFDIIVQKLEALSIMPKEMPGIEKITRALNDTNWFSKIDPSKVIVVAGTNGKGSTCAILESLLCSARKNVGFYSSPHLVDTTERIRVNQRQISKVNFVELYQQNQKRIEKFELTHFEALTVMAADYFFSNTWDQNLDYVIFEVGLGGTFDATNAIPHATSVITALSLDHTNILGHDLISIAKNKFGIVSDGNKVIHHPLPTELNSLVCEVRQQTQSTWLPGAEVSLMKSSGPQYFLQTPWGMAEMNLMGERAAMNASTALAVFASLGFDPGAYLSALNQVNWKGRMQKIEWPSMKAPVYVSGDHNPQGIESLLDLLNDFSWNQIHVVVGIGKDKAVDSMLRELLQLKNIKLYLTETPFKGLALAEYPQEIKMRATESHHDVGVLLDRIAQQAHSQDLVLVTGSLYLVGEILKKI